MRACSLQCVECGAEYGLLIMQACRKCGGSLDVVYDYSRLSFPKLFRSDVRGIWRYAELLPVRKGVAPVSMGEGDTPLFRAERLAKYLEIRSLYIKNETVNPTLAFKDRPMSVGVTVARQFGSKRLVAASTGNTAVSAAAYGARADMPVRIFVPADTPAAKLRLIDSYGAKVVRVRGNFSDAYNRAWKESVDKGAFNLTSTFLNPYACEGDKTLAYEIVEQFGGVPDWIVIPIGAGPFLVYCLKGFVEMRVAGVITRLPRMVGVQGAGCAPIAKAFERGDAAVKAWGKPSTLAGAVADPLTTYPADGTRTLKAIRMSGGLAIAVPEDEIMKHVRLLAEFEGLFAEPGAALATAACAIMRKRGILGKSQSIVAVITGHGIKDLG